MGFQTTSKSRYVCQYTTLLIDPDGSVKEIVIPYHFSLTEKNSKRVRDLHLYKRLKQYIKFGNYDEESLVTEAFNTCSEIKTIEVKLQLLEFLISNREIHPEVILKCVNHFIEKINMLNSSEMEADTKALKIISDNLNALVNFYTQVTDANQELDITNGNFECSNALNTNAVLGIKEMDNLQKLLDLSTLNNYKTHDLKVSFKENGKKSLSSFLKVFDLSIEGTINLKKDIEELALFQVAETIFARYIIGNLDTSELKEQFKNSTISINNLFYLVLNYWVNRPLNIDINLEREMRNLSAVIYCLAQNAKYEDLIVDNNSTSPFWTGIRQLLMNSSKSFPALMAAILCKGVAQRIENEKEFQKSSEEDFEVWENLSQENCEWTLLIGKLEDVSLLNIILANDPICNSALPKLKYTKESVSLKFILEKGRGSVSELVAKWLTLRGVHPRLITLNEINYQNSISSEQSVSQQKDNINPVIISNEDLAVLGSEPVFDHLNILRKQFPYSLNSNVLLTNMTWEYAVAWQKDIQEI
ncbi:rab3-gap regulatory domain [Holotrichia oblita]|uniref:Rab3-gap regulatory domain n=1 Tax=Holotrichia oblita TaxID=644536 RepID=A0ACB9T186_HOLOL|nr:rab3-gap regulatory domain [Holotrichia oblita]